MRRLILTALAAELLLASIPLHAQQRRGAFAFHYGPPLSAREMQWYSRFDVLVTHDCLPLAQVRELHRSGTKLFFYEWSVAFYATRADAWERSLIGKRSDAVLNVNGLRGTAGSDLYDAYYFDPADPAGRQTRARLLAERLTSCAYDGIFLDTTRFESVHPAAREEYTRRHPQLDYDVAYSQFLATLKSAIGARMLFTNQGYRDANNFLPRVDWDLTESYITYPCDGRYIARPWNDPHDPWNSTKFILQRLVEPGQKRFSRVRIGHLNYIDRPDHELIHLVVAVARLFNSEGYVAANVVEDEMDDVYFWDPGKALTPRVDQGGATYRFFENGVVIVNGGTAAFKLKLTGKYVNLTTKQIVEREITVPPASSKPVAYVLRRAI